MGGNHTTRGKNKRNTVVITILTLLCVIINMACSHFRPAIDAFMLANLNTRISALKSGNSNVKLSVEEAEKSSKEMAKTLEEEGIVLLENNSNALPMETGTKVNLFGYGSVSPLYGGTGSGTSDASKNIDLVQGLKNAGFEVNQELVDFYKKSGVKRPAQDSYTGSNFTPCEVSADQYSDQLMSKARDYSEVAIITLSRIGGEGGDLPIDMYKAGYSKTDDSRNYLQLTKDEEDLIQLVKSQNYKKVIVLINSSNAMELGFLKEQGIDAALWIGGPGSTGFDAVGEVLSGAVTPSGRLVDTYAYDLTTSPAYYNMGSFDYSNVKGMHYTEYQEGIYVGYRYYETRFINNETGECDEDAYQKTVEYPFGYGMSYTTFEQTIEDKKITENTIEVKVKVKNTGSVAGKDVVQIYYTAPYTVGGIEKSQVVLAGTEKTDVLKPGKDQTVTVSFKIEDMASYDYVNSKAYVLDAGDYTIRLMKNAHETIDSFTYNQPEQVVYDENNMRSTDQSAVTNQFDDVTNGQITTYVSRADWEGTMPTTRAEAKDASEETKNALTAKAVYEEDAKDEAITYANHGLSLKDMKGLKYDDPKWDQLLEQLSSEDMANMISNGGWSTPEVESVGKPATSDFDGPTGINSLTSKLQGTSFPSEVVVASTWNLSLAQEYGETFGDEAVANNVVGLYAPGVNIHRTPFSGRNFEYYSEDGFLNGKMASEFLQGTSSRGVYCYVKHFALNDQESDRLSVCVWSNEQAMRELYLKPFELSVKEGKATAIMSSYSRIGNVWAGAQKGLLTNVLREEWGFQGMVVTDSAMGNTSWMDINLGIRAGNDMMLCLMGVDISPSQKSNTGLQAMRQACHNILYTQANSAALSLKIDTTPYWLVLLAVVDVLLIGCIILLVLKRTKLGSKMKPLYKVGVFVVLTIAAVLILVFGCFRSQGIATADDQAAQEEGSGSMDAGSAEDGAQQEEAGTSNKSEAAVDGLFVQMDDKAQGWLGCHVSLMEDGTFNVTYDYNEDNSGIQEVTGTWEEAGDGNLTLTTADGKDTYPVTVTENEDGTCTYTMKIVNANTQTECNPTGTKAASDHTESTGGAKEETASIEGLFVELDGKGQEWLGCHVYLMEDGTFTVTYDYNEDNSGIQEVSGTWEDAGDGTLALTSDNGADIDPVIVTEKDGTATYTLKIVNQNTQVECDVTGTLKK